MAFLVRRGRARAPRAGPDGYGPSSAARRRARSASRSGPSSSAVASAGQVDAVDLQAEARVQARRRSAGTSLHGRSTRNSRAPRRRGGRTSPTGSRRGPASRPGSSSRAACPAIVCRRRTMRSSAQVCGPEAQRLEHVGGDELAVARAGGGLRARELVGPRSSSSTHHGERLGHRRDPAGDEADELWRIAMARRPPSAGDGRSSRVSTSSGTASPVSICARRSAIRRSRCSRISLASASARSCTTAPLPTLRKTSWKMSRAQRSCVAVSGPGVPK